MIAKQDVQQELDTVSEEKSESDFLKAAVPGVVTFLKTQPADFWKNYGMYWWNMMNVLKAHDPKAFREYAEEQGGESTFGGDPDMQKKYDYGSDAMNFVAAQMYLEDRSQSFGLGADTPHFDEDIDGNERSYIPSVGFIDETEQPQ